MKSLKTLTLFILLFSISFAQTQKVSLGIDVLAERNFDVLVGKKVGLITNPTGVNKELVTTIDILSEAENVDLVALYGPEHGVRGDYAAGDKVENTIDEKTGIPVFSLYGKTRKPTPEMLEGIDVLVFDIQDIGCRSYTYISTMGVAMEAAAENGVEFVVLDRPNPLSGMKYEGNYAEDGFISFVSQFKIPYVHGLTTGELANLLNDEAMLENGVICDLTVVPMEGWKREMSWEETGLMWVPSSPHIPHANSPKYYVSTGILGELGVISEGVGYTIPFHTFAAEWIDGQDLADEMNKLNLPGVYFRPLTFKPYYGKHQGRTISGVQIYITDYEAIELMSLQYHFMEVHNNMYPDKNPFELCDPSRISMFDKVSGTSKVRELFSQNFKYADIDELLHKDIEDWKTKIQKYFLY